MPNSIDIKNSSDTELISLYKESGDVNLVGELFHRYQHLVFGVCMKYMKHEENSRDATIEIFEHIMKKLKEHEVTNFKSWLYSVAKNHCFMQFRKNKNHIEVGEEFGEFVEWKLEVHPTDAVEREEKINQLERAIMQLNDKQRICIDMFYIREKSYHEIMNETRLTFKEVKSFIQNGKRNLKIILTEQHERKS